MYPRQDQRSGRPLELCPFRIGRRLGHYYACNHSAVLSGTEFACTRSSEDGSLPRIKPFQSAKRPALARTGRAHHKGFHQVAAAALTLSVAEAIMRKRRWMTPARSAGRQQLPPKLPHRRPWRPCCVWWHSHSHWTTATTRKFPGGLFWCTVSRSKAQKRGYRKVRGSQLPCSRQLGN
jgi:hypothetical protein